MEHYSFKGYLQFTFSFHSSKVAGDKIVYSEFLFFLIIPALNMHLLVVFTFGCISER